LTRAIQRGGGRNEFLAGHGKTKPQNPGSSVGSSASPPNSLTFAAEKSGTLKTSGARKPLPLGHPADGVQDCVGDEGSAKQGVDAELLGQFQIGAAES
jgi:hypothetical protein